MQLNSFSRQGLCLALALALAACGHSTQITSGKDYLSKYPQASAQAQVSPQIPTADNAGGRVAFDAQVRAAADVESTLRFPARIGIARLRDGQLASVAANEAGAWMNLAKRLGPDWGELVPISPLIAALASQPETEAINCWSNRQGCLEKTLRAIRLGAARQHVDAVLVYEAFARGEVTSNPIAVTKLALIGFFLPSEDVSAEGHAQAVLVDVRNGYTYGMASAQSDKAAFALASSVNQDEVANRMNLRAETAAVQALAPEVESMLRDLRLKLAEMRVAEASTN